MEPESPYSPSSAGARRDARIIHRVLTPRIDHVRDDEPPPREELTGKTRHGAVKSAPLSDIHLSERNNGNENESA